jgi:hypothetical protein
MCRWEYSDPCLCDVCHSLCICHCSLLQQCGCQLACREHCVNDSVAQPMASPAVSLASGEPLSNVSMQHDLCKSFGGKGSLSEHH